MNPSVSAVVPTRDRPELVRRAIQAILDQDYDGFVEVIVVYDNSEPDYSLSRIDGNRVVRVITNNRISGLAGARNTGVLASDSEFVGNCDDDDEWLPGKLAAQVAALEGAPEAELCCTGVRLVYEDQPIDRVLSGDRVVLSQLLRSRLQELHPSSFLFRRAALVDGIGLVSEELPSGQSEDYEMLLRVARRGPIINVPMVGVSALRHRGSYFNTRWGDQDHRLAVAAPRISGVRDRLTGYRPDHRSDRLRARGHRQTARRPALGRPDHQAQPTGATRLPGRRRGEPDRLAERAAQWPQQIRPRHLRTTTGPVRPVVYRGTCPDGPRVIGSRASVTVSFGRSSPTRLRWRSRAGASRIAPRSTCPRRNTRPERVPIAHASTPCR